MRTLLPILFLLPLQLRTRSGNRKNNAIHLLRRSVSACREHCGEAYPDLYQKLRILGSNEDEEQDSGGDDDVVEEEEDAGHEDTGRARTTKEQTGKGRPSAMKRSTMTKLMLKEI